METEINYAVGMGVKHPAFGQGTVTKVVGDLVTANFADGEHLIKAYALEPRESTESALNPSNSADSVQTVDQAIDEIKAKISSCWLRGREWRFEMGHLLCDLRERVKASGTRDFTTIVVDEIKLPKRSAYDYMKEYEDTLPPAEEPEPVYPEGEGNDLPEPKNDPQATLLATLTNNEKKAREGRKPTVGTTITVKLRDVLASHAEAYETYRKTHITEVNEGHMNWFHEIVGRQQAIEAANEANAFQADDDDVPAEVGGKAEYTALTINTDDLVMPAYKHVLEIMPEQPEA